MSLHAQKIAKKKEDIIKAATAIVTEKGYLGTTMEEIAATLLMTKGSVYYYFDNKQDLLYQCFILLLNESIANIEKVEQQNMPYKEKLHQAMVVHIVYVLRERGEFELVTKKESFFDGEQLEHILALRNDYEQLFDRIIAGGVKQRVFLPVDIKIVRNLILGAMNWMIEWYSEDGEKNLDDFAETSASYLMRLVLYSEIENGGIENGFK
ncbi:TetR/AcrR family transcriptional regulator [Planococcus faecalis]|uniref:TetR family transcriptional regulator n=1 Tax=Planococcus faecalis TaxID=1598147 RepID=A0ABN4XRZ8_9BACL|nr:TetR/AcrR family transcriptional regulator [Planococcus faecalis]AQU80485.1 TetR family transcriptional regulator [Planococcus faecalis]OHX52141.1 transcriptional regulator [Planococcus faecalis]